MSQITATLLFVAVLLGAVFARGAARVLSAWWRFRGTRLVTCPQTNAPAAVTVDASSAACAALVEGQSIALADCSRWPSRRFCGQQCLEQVKADPYSCRVSTIVERWFEGKTCVYCGNAIPCSGLDRHHPALLGLDGTTFEWSAVPPERLPAVFPTHVPVCWDCHVAETFRQTYPELVTNREISR